jgi:hypothetical protein
MPKNSTLAAISISSTIISIISLTVALGGAAFSATGGNFILGRVNSANTQTTLISDGNSKTLLLSNLSTSANAAALGLTVKPGRPPLVVNSGAKVANLNVDLLDGIDSSEFHRGKIFFAEVQANGTLANQCAGCTVTSASAGAAGAYEVDFGRNIATCTHIAGLGNPYPGAQVGQFSASDRAGNPEAVYVLTTNSGGNPASLAFRLIVVC